MRKIRKGLYTDKNENLRVEKTESGWEWKMYDFNNKVISGIADSKNQAIEDSYHHDKKIMDSYLIEAGIL